MLTASGTETDRIIGLELGADDYVVKPFSSGEVISRIRAVLRRAAWREPDAPETIRSASWSSTAAARRATLAGEELKLPRKEFDLLAELVRHAGEVVGREDLMARVWDVNWFGSTKTLDVHIRSLRKKLGDDPADPTLHRDGARRGLPLRRAGGCGAVSLRARLLLASAYLLLLAIVALGIPLALSLRDRVDTEVRSQARSQADVVAATRAELVGHGRRATLDRLTRISAAQRPRAGDGGDGSGRVIADSAGARRWGRSYRSRPEVATALQGRQAIRRRAPARRSERSSSPRPFPIVHGGRTVGAVRITQSVEAVNSAVRRAIARARRPERDRARPRPGRRRPDRPADRPPDPPARPARPAGWPPATSTRGRRSRAAPSSGRSREASTR